MSETKQLNRERKVESLSPSEKKKLQKLITGYGNLKDSAITAQLHHQTLRSIAKFGKGDVKSLDKIRTALLQ